MKKGLFTSLLILATSVSFAQNVGIGTATPNASAKLHIVDASRGVLVPNVALSDVTVAAPVTSPATGLLVWNTAAGVIGGSGVGFYYWDGAKWVRLMNSDDLGDEWHLLGNASTNPATNFVGTTDAQDLVFRTNSVENMRINTSGNIDIGSGLDDARIYARVLNSDLTTNYGAYIYHDGGISAGTTYGIRNLNYTATDGDKYGLYNYTNDEGIGNRYGFYNSTYLNAASTDVVYGMRNYVSTSGSPTSGTQYGLYNFMISTNALGSHYGQRNYLYLNPASVASDFGEMTYVDYSSGLRYGEYKELATNSGFAGTIYGDYNTVSGAGNDVIYGVLSDITNTGTGSHYGFYSNVPGGTNDYAAYFNAGNVVANEIGGDYDFRIEGDTETNLFVVDASFDHVGIGIATPGFRLDVRDPDVSATTYVYRGRNGTATGTQTQIGSIEYFMDQSSTIDFTGGSNLGINMNAAASFNLQLSANSAAKPGSSTWVITSDARLKEDVNPFKEGLSTLRDIKPVYFKYNGEANIREENYFVGVIAQELEEVAPYMVGSYESAPGDIPFEKQEAATETYKTVDNGAMTYIAINAIKELDAQQTKMKEVFRTISDFGVNQMDAIETFVPYGSEFKNSLQGLPVVTVSPINSSSSLTIVNQTAEGFTVRLIGNYSPIQFNWVAMAKVKESALSIDNNYSAQERQTLLQKVHAENATINYEAEYEEIEKRKIEEAAENVIRDNQEKAGLEVEKHFEQQKINAEQRKLKDQEDEKKQTEESED